MNFYKLKLDTVCFPTMYFVWITNTRTFCMDDQVWEPLHQIKRRRCTQEETSISCDGQVLFFPDAGGAAAGTAAGAGVHAVKTLQQTA